MDFARLEKNIIDVIKEEQAKLGYRKEKIRLYYPLSSLNHFFQLDVDETGMQEKLSRFSEYEEGKLGRHDGDFKRFSFLYRREIW